MKLFLTSSGFSNENEPQFLSMLSKDPAHTHIAFITTAYEGKRLSVPDDEVARMIKTTEDYQGLVRLGFSVTLIDLANLKEENIIATFEPFDVIYVYGGNTFYLLHHVHHSGFGKHIKEILTKKMYVGVSAGSIIAGPDIALAGWQPGGDENTIGIENMTGMNLVPFCILPHWQEGREIPMEAREYPYEIRYLVDGKAIITQ